MITSLADFPADLLIAIFQHLNFHDLSSCAKTCITFNEISNENFLWKKLFLIRWKYTNKGNDDASPTNFRTLYKQHHISDFEFLRILEKISRAASQSEIHQLMDVRKIARNHWDLLKEIIQIGLEDCYGDSNNLFGVSINFSMVFYARKISEIVVREETKAKWKKLLSTPNAQILLEDGAILIDQYMHPLEDIEQICKNQLDELASKVRERISTLIEPTPKVLLHELGEFLFQEEDFHGNLQNYYTTKNSFFHWVLKMKTGIPITLSIVFEAVGRRLGLKIDPIGFPGHFLLGCKISEETTMLIDSFNKKIFSETSDYASSLFNRLPHFSPEMLTPCSAKDVFFRMMSNLRHIYQNFNNPKLMEKLVAVLDQALLIEPNLQDFIYKLRVLILLEEVDEVKEIIEGDVFGDFGLHGDAAASIRSQILQNIQDKNSNETTVINRLVDPYKYIKYKIGQVVVKKNGNDEEVYGVIIGYSNIYGGKNALYNRADGPLSSHYYLVLWNKTFIISFTSERNFKIAEEPKPLSKCKHLGKYFTRFDRTLKIYIPNERLQLEYPNL